MNLRLRLSPVATVSPYTTLAFYESKFADKPGVQQMLLPGTQNAIMGGFNLGASYRFSRVSLSFDGAAQWSQHATLSQVRLMLGFPISFNTSWEFRPSIGYRSTLVSVGSEMGLRSETRSGVAADFELALPLNSFINFLAAVNGTVSNGATLAEVQPGVALGVEIYFGGSTPYRKPARGAQLALAEMRNEISELMQELSGADLAGITPHLSLLIAASKKRSGDIPANRIKAHLDKIDSLAIYVAQDTQLSHPIQNVSNDLAQTLAAEIVEDKLGVVHKIMEEGNRLLFWPHDFQTYGYLIGLYTTMIEDLIKRRPETTRTLNPVLTQLYCLQGKSDACDPSVMRVSWSAITKANQDRQNKVMEFYFNGGAH